MKIKPKSYKETYVYRTSKQAVKSDINNYKDKYDLDNEYLYYALRLYDLKHLDKDEVRKASSGAQYATIFSALSFVAISANNVDKRVLLINAILFLIFLIIYLGGFTNHYTNEKRALRKLLKKKGIKEEFITSEELKQKATKEDEE